MKEADVDNSGFGDIIDDSHPAATFWAEQDINPKDPLDSFRP